MSRHVTRHIVVLGTLMMLLSLSSPLFAVPSSVSEWTNGQCDSSMVGFTNASQLQVHTNPSFIEYTEYVDSSGSTVVTVSVAGGHALGDAPPAVNTSHVYIKWYNGNSFVDHFLLHINKDGTASIDQATCSGIQRYYHWAETQKFDGSAVHENGTRFYDTGYVTFGWIA